MVNKINKTSIDFFYKVPLKNAYELIEKLCMTGMFKTGDRSNFEGDNQENVIYHTASEDYNADIWIEVDPEQKGVAFIDGLSGPFEIFEGMGKRWAAFEEVYKYLKGLEVSGELKRLEEEHGQEFGGKMHIMDESEEVPKEKNFQIGSYVIKSPNNPLKEVKIEDSKKIKTLTVESEGLFFEKEGTYPLIGVMEDKDRIAVGTLKHECVVDVFGKSHNVLKLSINDEFEYSPEDIAKFSNTALRLINDNKLDIEGILPDDKIRYNEYGMKNIILLENGDKFFCVSPKTLSLDSVREHQENSNMSIIPSSLEYGDEGRIDLSDIQADRIVVKTIEDDGFNSTNINFGGFSEQKIVIDDKGQNNKAILRVTNNSPFICNLPDVESFFKDKEDSYVEFNTPFNGISMDSIKDSNINKARTWVINFPLDTVDSKSSALKYFMDMREKGIELPDRFIFNKGLLMDGKVVKGRLGKEMMNEVLDEINKTVKQDFDKMTEFPEL